MTKTKGKRYDHRAEIESRLADEMGTLRSGAAERVVLLYPSPYHVGMSSLGFQAIYGVIHDAGYGADRAFLPDDVDAHRESRTPLLTYEAQRPVGTYPIIATSVAYELEITGLVDSLELAGVPALACDRDERHPFVLAGGPLTFSNPLPLGPFVDAVLLGEAEMVTPDVIAILFSTASREDKLAHLQKLPGMWIPTRDGERLPAVAAIDNDRLPACSRIITPHTELRSMFLVEPERGCSRGCTYCVMRRSTNGGMRLVPPDRVLGAIPDYAKRVGLVGAAVTDHPKICEIVRRVVDSGRDVGISSLRADRLNDELVGLLAKGGYRTLTTASDGVSERMREVIQRKTKEKHLVRAAELARANGMRGLKLYEMVGVPGETDDDIDELVRFARELSKIIPLALGVAPFVAKRNTPLDGSPFAGIKVVEHKLDVLARGLKGRVEVRPTSARWAWVEYMLAQGGTSAGLRALAAHRAGGKFSDWKRAFEEEGWQRKQLRVVA
ncbi:MAG: radical SAM protein [Polyangia bacterium]